MIYIYNMMAGFCKEKVTNKTIRFCFMLVFIGRLRICINWQDCEMVQALLGNVMRSSRELPSEQT